MSFFFEDMEPLLLLSSKFRNFSGMAIKQVTDSMSTVPCRGGDAAAEVMACRDESAALRLKMVAVVAILVAGVMGVTIPLIGMKTRFVRTGSGYFAFLKAFAAGVILATGFVHMLPGGQSALSDPCLPKSPWSDFPFSGFVAMLAALATLAGDFLATQFYERKHRMEEEEVVAAWGGKPSSSVVVVDDEDGIGIVVEEPGVVGVWQRGKCKEDGDGMHAHHAASHRHCHERTDGACEGHVHSHTHALEEGGGSGPSPQVRHIVISQILEVGIVSHSVLIGLSLGVSHSPCTIPPLIAALSFHQFFEGFALGGCISQAEFQNLAATLMACFFALTTPVGIAAGTAVASFYDAYSPRALVVEGMFDCVSAGILIYMALVDLIAVDFLSRNKSSNIRLQVGSYLALFLGAGSMSLLAMWA